MHPKKRLLLAAAGCAFVAMIAAPSARASEWDKKTTVTFNSPIEVPGTVLQPGKYVMRLVDLSSSRHIVQFMNDRENHVFTTALAIPAYRITPADHSVFTFYETPGGQPEAMKAWYYPGDNFGQEFAYPKDRALALSRATNQNVPGTDFNPRAGSIAPAPDDPANQAAAASTVNEPAPAAAPVVIAQNIVPSPEPAAASDLDDNRPVLTAQNNTPPPPAEQPSLPKTATQTVAFAFIGLSALAGGLAVRRYQKSS